jgi:hypothetical protein
MEQSKLSEYYAIATDRSMRVMVDLYESLHNESGNPIEDHQKVSEEINKAMTLMKHEMDLCTEAVKEFNKE